MVRRPLAPWRVSSAVSAWLYPDRAPHRGGDHRDPRGYRDPEVRQHEGEGIHRRDEVRPAEPRDGRGSLLLRQHELHNQPGADEQLLRVDRSHAGRERGHARGMGGHGVERHHHAQVLPLLGHCDAPCKRYDRRPYSLPVEGAYREFARRREGMCFALDGGVWLHRHKLRGEPMVHLVSADRDGLLALGRDLGLRQEWLQYKPLKDPRTGQRVPAWHWDLWGEKLRLVG